MNIQDIINYIHSCIDENKEIYRTSSGGFTVLGEISAIPARFSTQGLIVSRYIGGLWHNDIADIPFTEYIIRDIPEDDWLEFEKALLDIKKYNNSQIEKLIKQ